MDARHVVTSAGQKAPCRDLEDEIDKHPKHDNIWRGNSELGWIGDKSMESKANENPLTCAGDEK